MNKDFQNLQGDIISSLGLGRSEATGFHALVCPICRNERATGGFKFESDKIIYNCFRGSCDASCVHEFDTPLSRKFKNLMEVIGVKIPMAIRAKRSVISEQIKRTLDAELYEKNTYQELTIPDGWIPLATAEGNFAENWRSKFEKRCCDIVDVYLITSGTYRNLVACCLYYFDKIIGFEVITAGGDVKYIHETINTGLLFFPEHTVPQIPILVEGFFDAKCFPNTVATFNSSISKKQAYMLTSTKEWWLYPDKGKNKYMEIMQNYPNCKMIIPDWEYKDLNDAVCNLGVIEVAKRIKGFLVDNVQEARIKYKLWANTGAK
ncbi:hypothetical protein [Alishewanella phage vB_AspM_Slicko01]|nr:hypothetical protein [Alishewanella phage vB_AspM_Slicko01]